MCIWIALCALWLSPRDGRAGPLPVPLQPATLWHPTKHPTRALTVQYCRAGNTSCGIVAVDCNLKPSARCNELDFWRMEPSVGATVTAAKQLTVREAVANDSHQVSLLKQQKPVKILRSATHCGKVRVLITHATGATGRGLHSKPIGWVSWNAADGTPNFVTEGAPTPLHAPLKPSRHTASRPDSASGSGFKAVRMQATSGGAAQPARLSALPGATSTRAASPAAAAVVSASTAASTAVPTATHAVGGPTTALSAVAEQPNRRSFAILTNAAEFLRKQMEVVVNAEKLFRGAACMPIPASETFDCLYAPRPRVCMPRQLSPPPSCPAWPLCADDRPRLASPCHATCLSSGTMARASSWSTPAESPIPKPRRWPTSSASS